MIIDTTTLYNAVILTIITTFVIYAIINASPPAFLIDDKKNLRRLSTIFYSFVIASFVSAAIGLLSMYVDKQYYKNHPLTNK